MKPEKGKVVGKHHSDESPNSGKRADPKVVMEVLVLYRLKKKKQKPAQEAVLFTRQ